MSEQLEYVTGRIIIEMGLTKDGHDQVWTSVSGASEDDYRPPLVTVLGMLEMARTTVYEIYTEIGTPDP